MPFFAVVCHDKPGHLEVRKANRDAHVAYLKATSVAQAGPFLDAHGDMCGSLLILDVHDMAAAEDWAANDPYAKADLFESVTIKAWNRVIG
ncbi:YCII-like domain-containing protein [Actibacterium atlanticum]|uniref:YCII-like domain-containing protein n=1 Tax=Actibacterium atlanticum TaxID=1461693 RepID=A0A058ZMW8_9RHOB|nr:YciI family protein [Actibacterium atlanticum]KCV82570.1 YCII-like domain-containing protein [Actibacterium atlanticum]